MAASKTGHHRMPYEISADVPCPLLASISGAFLKGLQLYDAVGSTATASPLDSLSTEWSTQNIPARYAASWMFMSGHVAIK